MRFRRTDWRVLPARPTPLRLDARAAEGTDTADDRALVGAVRGGCELAERRFVARMVCIPRSVSHLNQSTRLAEAAVEDVVQEVFRRVWANLGGYRGEGSLEAWVFGFVQRTMHEFARNELKWARARSTEDEEAPWLDDALLHDDADVCDRIVLAEAYEQLPAELRELLEARLVEGASFHELALRHAVSASLVKRRYYDALARLRSATKERSA